MTPEYDIGKAVRESGDLGDASVGTLVLADWIEEKNPEAEKIVVISDNAAYYRAVLVKEFLETSKIKMGFLPSYSPNLNLIERLWKFFKGKITRGKYYEKFEEFRTKTLEFF